MEKETFVPIKATSKFSICGLPLRLDTYKTCSFGCQYCFANNRKIMEHEKEMKVGDVDYIKRKLNKIFDNNDYNENNFRDKLIADKITWHCGGLADPFQHTENKYEITKKVVDITNEYDISILFSTKSDKLYDVNLKPNLHSIQMSITNLQNHNIERNVPSISKRIKLFKYLKKRGFKVGIRIQPFLPGITEDEIVDVFKDADYFTIEGLKLVPQNKKHKTKILNELNLNRSIFTQMGLLNIKPEIREKLYEGIIKKLEKYNLPYSVADNDMHYKTKSKCCCGENLVKKSTSFNKTALYYKYGDYDKEDLYKELGEYANCKVNHLFTSNRQEGCTTAKSFFDKRFHRSSSPFSKEFDYIKRQRLFSVDLENFKIFKCD